MAQKKRKKSSKSKRTSKKRSIKKKRTVAKKMAVRKKSVKKNEKKESAKTKPSKVGPKLPKEPIGRVTHYFSKARAAAAIIERDNIRIGDTLFFKGHTTQFKQIVQSLQINCQPVQQASPGDEIGIGVRSKVREHDLIYKL